MHQSRDHTARYVYIYIYIYVLICGEIIDNKEMWTYPLP